MAKRSTRRRTAPKRALIVPLIMLATGMALGVVVWRFLMLDPPWAGGVSEQLSSRDREALERLLRSQP